MIQSIHPSFYSPVKNESKVQNFTRCKDLVQARIPPEAFPDLTDPLVAALPHSLPSFHTGSSSREEENLTLAKADLTLEHNTVDKSIHNAKKVIVISSGLQQMNTSTFTALHKILTAFNVFIPSACAQQGFHSHFTERRKNTEICAQPRQNCLCV